jgi:hypothetical protein
VGKTLQSWTIGKRPAAQRVWDRRAGPRLSSNLLKTI